MHHELPRRLDLEHYRKEAKSLVRAVRAGDADAIARAQEVLGARARDRFLLSDAQYVIATEHGYRSWGQFRRSVERARPEPPVGRIGAGPLADYEERARELVAQVRAAREDALRRVRAHLPRFEGGELSERDARVVVAHEYGFPTWRQLAYYVRKAEEEARRRPADERLEARAAIVDGDVERLRGLLDTHPGLADDLLEDLTQPGVLPRRQSGPAVELVVARADNIDVCLNLAACFDRVELVQLLLDAGASVDGVEIWGITPLETALYHAARRAAVLLAQRKIVPFALWTAAALGRIDLMETFFDADGALRPEAGAHRPDLSKVGWPPGPPPRDDEREILEEAFVHACHNGRIDAAAWLLDRGVDADARPYAGLTGLHLAVSAGLAETVRFLVERGADTTLRDEVHDATPLGWAEHLGDAACRDALSGTGVTYGDGEPVRIRIRRRGRRIDIDDGGETVRRAGKPPGWREVAERLVAEEGFNVNRAGVVFVGAVEGRDVNALARRLAATCASLYGELLELAG
jgi:ankyrin repeat protein